MKTPTLAQVKEYLELKTAQYIRITGFDTKQENAKEHLSSAVQPLLKGWMQEIFFSTGRGGLK